ncbi:hypothetical protein CC117_09725 [Parafrankia colletiae]|uniref:Uncharacterized protein n=1 Tax=Parafrankia colletiae TaxID=573497 RepID=A0A1S1RGU5_9ACTN|nr:hypothetical protein CC117_09725 [Parafrankia colletiae]
MLEIRELPRSLLDDGRRCLTRTGRKSLGDVEQLGVRARRSVAFTRIGGLPGSESIRQQPEKPGQVARHDPTLTFGT